MPEEICVKIKSQKVVKKHSTGHVINPLGVDLRNVCGTRKTRATRSEERCHPTFSLTIKPSMSAGKVASRSIAK